MKNKNEDLDERMRGEWLVTWVARSVLFKLLRAFEGPRGREAGEDRRCPARGRSDLHEDDPGAVSGDHGILASYIAHSVLNTMKRHIMPI